MKHSRMTLLFVLITVVGVLLFTVNQLHLSSSISSIVSPKGEKSLGLTKIADIPLSGGANRLDYQSVEYSTNRLYISHLGSNMVHVVDLQQQKIVKDIQLSSSPYGILAVPSLKEVFVGVGGSNQVAVIDETTLDVTKYIQAGETPDGIAYSAGTQQVFVSNENGGTVSVIDAKTNEYVIDIPIGGAVGNSQNFTQQNRIYTVAGIDNTFIEIDPTTNKVVNRYQLPGCSRPHGFYIDPETSYAFITCDVNNVLLVFDLDSKKVVATDTVGAIPDVLAYDGGFHRLYVAGESGVMTIFDIQKGNVRKIYEGFIAAHAHTVAVDQTTHLVYLPLENVDGKPALRILKPTSK